MYNVLNSAFFLLNVVSSLTLEPELPLCPSNIQYFPQNLPLHCRMPINMPYPAFPPGPMPFPMPLPGPIPLPLNPTESPSVQNPFPDKPPPLPIPLPPMPGMMPMPMPMPVGPIPAGPAHKLPVIVMPFYSPDPAFKRFPVTARPRRRPRIHKRRPRYKPRYSDSSDNSDTDTSDTSRETDDGWWRKQRSGRRTAKMLNRRRKSKGKHYRNRELLKPVLQYVTKDGYVIYEKEISKGEAKDWLHMKNDNAISTAPPQDVEDLDSKEVENISSNMNNRHVEDGKVEVRTERNPHRRRKVKVNSNIGKPER